MIERVYHELEAVREEFAPDPRTAVFEVDVTRAAEGLVLYGAVSVPAAAEALHRRIASLDPALTIRDAIERIPETGAGTQPHGLITAAIAPMLAGPLISESHLSQLVLGSRVTVLREHGRWYQCRAQDGYIGWLHRGYVRRVDEIEARAWELGGGAPVHFSLGAVAVDTTGSVITRLPWGARFGLRDGSVVLPDGRTGALRGSAVGIAELPRRFPNTGEAVVETARRWMGSPYLWGGTTPWGVDCSGLVQATFRVHGIELPRDSDQQAEVGAAVPLHELATLRPGDLLYFAEQRDRISHVAISTGGASVIHSAVGNGGVGENDLEGEGGYERELRSLLVAIRRVIEAVD